MTSLLAPALALTAALMFFFAFCSGADLGKLARTSGAPRIRQTGRLMSRPRVVTVSSGGGKPACEVFRGKTSADGDVTSARTCGDGSLLVSMVSQLRTTSATAKRTDDG